GGPVRPVLGPRRRRGRPPAADRAGALARYGRGAHPRAGPRVPRPGARRPGGGAAAQRSGAVRFRARPNVGGRLDRLAASLRPQPFRPLIPGDGAGEEEWLAALEQWAAAGLFDGEPAGAEALARLRRAVAEASRSPDWRSGY